MQKIPYMLVIGDREAESESVSVRHRKHADMGAKSVTQFIEEVCKLVESKAVAE
jgi:threonyl-tRNA synthetase